jgi:broad specificity phosphatase PhoE
MSASRDDTLHSTLVSASTTTTDSPLVRLLPPLPSDSQRLYLVRHGETDWNAQGLMQGGGYDIPLNKAGRAQALAAHTALQNIPLDVVASSHLLRSTTTADVIVNGTEYLEDNDAMESFSYQQNINISNGPARVVDPRFGEMRFGSFEGQCIKGPNSSTELRHTFDDWATRMHTDPTLAWPDGGESMWDVQTRARAGLEELLRTYPHSRHVCIVAHGRCNKILLASLLHTTEAAIGMQGNAAINVLDVNAQGEWKAHVLNYMDHMNTT